MLGSSPTSSTSATAGRAVGIATYCNLKTLPAVQCPPAELWPECQSSGFYTKSRSAKSVTGSPGRSFQENCVTGEPSRFVPWPRVQRRHTRSPEGHRTRVFSAMSGARPPEGRRSNPVEVGRSGPGPRCLVGSEVVRSR